jgi:hypothetical protein
VRVLACGEALHGSVECECEGSARGDEGGGGRERWQVEGMYLRVWTCNCQREEGMGTGGTAMLCTHP